jgi:hypothetical protein
MREDKTNRPDRSFGTSFIVFSAMGGEAMNLEERMKKRQADFFAAHERDPDNGIHELLIMYRGCGSDGADIIFEIFAPADVDPEHLEDEKKIVLGIVRRGFAKLPRLPDAPQRKLDELAADAIKIGFDARLAERLAKRKPKDDGEE